MYRICPSLATVSYLSLGNNFILCHLDLRNRNFSLVFFNKVFQHDEICRHIRKHIAKNSHIKV